MTKDVFESSQYFVTRMFARYPIVLFGIFLTSCLFEQFWAFTLASAPVPARYADSTSRDAISAVVSRFAQRHGFRPIGSDSVPRARDVSIKYTCFAQENMISTLCSRYKNDTIQVVLTEMTSKKGTSPAARKLLQEIEDTFRKEFDVTPVNICKEAGFVENLLRRKSCVNSFDE